MDFRYNLILIYFNTVKDLYSYSELLTILGITFEQLDIMLNKLIIQEYLSFSPKKILTLSEKALVELKENGFYGMNIREIYDIDEKEDNIFIHEKLDINDVYIPKGFTKKFNGYS